MSLSESGKRENALPVRDLLHAGRYYLGNRRALLILAVIVVVVGLASNWSWLVAIGVAPILLSALPCLVMCAFGACMMCRSANRKEAGALETGEQSAPPSSAGKVPQYPAACCRDSAPDAPSVQRASVKASETSQPEVRSGQPSA